MSRSFMVPSPTLNTVSPDGPNAGFGGALSLSSFASAAWPAANRAIFLPFTLAVPSVATQLFCLNGATASGNIDMGIYDASGTRIVSIGSTAQAGTSVLQLFNITDTPLGAGTFYVGLALDNTTGTIFRAPLGVLASTRFAGLVQMASAFALPATATYAQLASDYIPFCGVVFAPRTAI